MPLCLPLVFAAKGRAIPQGGVPPGGIVDAFDGAEAGHACLELRGQAASLEQCALEGGKEALAPGGVVGLPERAPRGPHAGFLAALAESQRSTLAAPGLPHGRDRWGRPGSGAGRASRVAPCRDRAAPPTAGADPTGRAPQPGNPLAAVPLSCCLQFGMAARGPLGLPRAQGHRPDPGQPPLPLMRPGPRRGRAVMPGVVAGPRHAEHACCYGDRERGPGRAHEPQEPDAITPLSRANQAVARERLSRSRRSCVFSRRSRLNASRSAALSAASAVSPISRRPPADQPGPPHCGSPGTRGRMREPDRPDHARHLPARPGGARNSGASGGCVWAINRTPRAKASSLSTKPGQLHSAAPAGRGGWPITSPVWTSSCSTNSAICCLPRPAARSPFI